MKFGMAKAILVLDENLEPLKESLQNRNFRVICPDKGTSDDNIKKIYLPHRTIVTNNSADFLEDAIDFEYSIIATELISFKDPENLSKMIARAWSQNQLTSKRSSFLLVLKEDGNHTFKELD
jgi:hypothetical protein